MSYTDVCKKVAALNDSIEATYLIEKDAVTQWTVKPYTKLPLADRMQTVVVQRALLFALANAHKNLLGDVHYIKTEYDDCDIYLFEVSPINLNCDTSAGKHPVYEEDNDDLNQPKLLLPIFEKNLLVVRMKRPYSQNKFVSDVSRILNIS